MREKPPMMQAIQAKKIPSAICRAIKRLLINILHSRIEGRYRTLGLLFLGLWFASAAHAQVSIGPWVVPMYLDNNGKPCSGCKLASFAAGTSTPQVTYSDPDGTFPNSNPIILDSSGRARVYLTGSAYKLVLSDASSNQIWSVDDVVSTNNGLLTSNNTWLGSQTFQSTSNFNGPVNFNVGFTSLGPNNLGGGGSMAGTFSGSPTFSGTPTFSNGFTVNGSTATFNGPIILNGNPAMGVLFTTQIPNLNASFLEGATWEAPLDIGTITPMDGTFAGLHATTNFQIASGALIGGTKGTDTTLLTAGTVSGTGNPICVDANGGATTSGCSTSGFTQIESVKKTSSTCTPGSASSFDNCTDILTWPHAFADTGYVATVSCVQPAASGSSGSVLTPMLIINSYSTTTITVITQQQAARTSPCTEIHAIGVHP